MAPVESPLSTIGVLDQNHCVRERAAVFDSRFPSMSSTYASPAVFGFGMLTAACPWRLSVEGVVVRTPGMELASPVIHTGWKETTEERSPMTDWAGSSPSLGFFSWAPRLS